MDDIDEINRLKASIYGSGRSWKAANIQVKSDGHWFTFYEPTTQKQLNSPRLKKMKKYKVSYIPKERKDPEPPAEPNPLATAKYDNYTRLPSRHLFFETPTNDAQRNTPNFHLPNLYPKPTEYRGNTPLELPLRFSTLLLNEKRQKERDEIYTARQTKRLKVRGISPPKTPRPNFNSLYLRSLKKDELEYKWEPGVEEMAESLYKKKQ